MSAKIDKVLIVISGDEYVRNYINIDTFESLETSFECYYLCSSKVTLTRNLKDNKGFLGFYEENDFQNKLSYNFFNVLMFKYRHISKSFNFRILRIFDFPYPDSFDSVNYLLRWLVKKIILIWKRFILRLKASELFFWIVNLNYKLRHKPNSDLSNILTKISPKIVIYPSTAYDPIGVDIVELCLKFNAKSLFIIDNWDNLSSKSILFKRPDYIAVWSKQCREHALNIQSFSTESVHIIGSARFNQYFKFRNQKLKSHFNFKYILFVGTAVKFDEISVLAKLNHIIKYGSPVFREYKILYRPHPWRQSDAVFEIDTFENVIIDPQIRREYFDKKNSTDFQPDLNYYPSLLQNCAFVIGGLTSMLIESLIFRKTSIALAHDDQKNLTSQHNIFSNYVHFEGIENLSLIKMCYDLNNLEDLMFSALSNQIDVNEYSKIDSEREYFLFNNSDLEFKDRLTHLVKNLI